MADRTETGTDTDNGSQSILHSRYGWHEIGSGLLHRKLRLFYGDDARRPPLLRLLIAPVALLYSVTAFFGGRGLGTYALVVLSVLVTYWCIRPLVISLIHCWQTTQIFNAPSMAQVSNTTGDPRTLRDPPTRVVDDRLVIDAPILAVDRSTTPRRIYTKGPFRHQFGWLGAYHHIAALETDVIVHHLGPILRVADDQQIPVEHLLATHEIHELAHWAVEDENEAIHDDHATAWNRRLGKEVRYVTGDDTALGRSDLLN